jgi:hypothetical protein
MKKINEKNELTRITIDIPKKSHKRLKTISAILGKSMREVVVESIDEYLCSEHVPNKTTLKAIKDAESRRGIVSAENAKDLFKKLGI